MLEITGDDIAALNDEDLRTLQHVPALVAVERGRIAWVVTGVLNDPAAVEPIVRSWTAR